MEVLRVLDPIPKIEHTPIFPNYLLSMDKGADFCFDTEFFLYLPCESVPKILLRLQGSTRESVEIDWWGEPTEEYCISGEDNPSGLYNSNRDSWWHEQADKGTCGL